MEVCLISLVILNQINTLTWRNPLICILLNISRKKKLPFLLIQLQLQNRQLRTKHQIIEITLKNLRVPLSSTDAEMRWVLKVVMAQFTFHSCLDIKDLFIPMFGEQEVLSKFSLSKTKYTYITNYEIAPYFKESLTQCIKESPF